MKFRKIPLTQGKFVIVDAEDYEYLNQQKWHFGNKGYAKRNEFIGSKKTRTILMHRLIINPPTDMQIDHINGNKLDNRRSNLRLSTWSTNQQNRPKLKGIYHSKYKGVTWEANMNKWSARITKDKVMYRLGYFEKEKDAALAYNEAAKKYHGEFANLSFI